MVSVGDVMTHDVVCIEAQGTLQEAIDLMDLRGCRHLVVIGEDGHVCGIVSDRDCRLALYSPYVLRERWQDESVLNHTRIQVIMTPYPLHVTSSLPLAHAAQKMLDHHINALVVIDRGEMVGIVTSSDVMRVYAQQRSYAEVD
ncbi:CBS domain-containing protein [Phototrophicus methaneseepsis]|uniref:CBS domain-containing protein n=1 Tax=Phototrophicus methaneseepsis TaxID=2710758 RepID=A0A7S8IGL7_9CHLR|nr:CBS domain-containing protein [Phototrophicus methaneseepsis]QPC84794.1 CBS domain-containing protein [Phototrophicus methaneseepsis]